MQLEVGSIVEGKITGITSFGAFVELPAGKNGMIHISEVSTNFVKDIKDYLKEGQIVKVKVINISEKGEVALSIKKAQAPKNKQVLNQNRSNGPGNFEWQSAKKSSDVSFEEMMSSFKHASEEKISDLKRATESKRGGFSRRGAQRS